MRAPLWAVALLLGCSSPPAKPIFEVHTHERTYRDDPFEAEVVTQFRTIDVLPELDVRSIAVSGDRVYAGTASGLMRLEGERFVRVPLAATGTSAIVDLFSLGDGSVLVATGAVVARAGDDLEEVLFRGQGIRAAAPGFVATDQGLFSGTALVASNLEIRDLEPAPGGVLIAAREGAFRFDGALSPMIPGTEDARAVSNGWIAAANALIKDSVTRKPQPGGLPTGELSAVAADSAQVMIGHAIGASAIAIASTSALAGEGDRVEHYHSLRWIPAEEVRGVAVGPGRTRWIATSGGISRIAYEPTTLRAKADAFEEMFIMRLGGFVADHVAFDSPYDHSAGPHLWDNDNDGLWTEMQVGTWCLAYAVTGDEKYYQRARRSMETMLMLIDVPRETFRARGREGGRFTRSLVRQDEGQIFESKKGSTEWHLQDFGGHTYLWKDTTSSDEYAGHYFGLPVYYDLCAKDEAERAEIRSRIKLATDYVIAGGYQTLDLEGRPTDFGWRDVAVAADGIDGCPDRHALDTCLISFGGGGWLNAMEALGMLLATWHITGDDYYYREYDRLYTEEKYGKMIPVSENTFTLSSPSIANHSDHELAVLAYFTLLRYEPNPDRRAAIIKSFRDFYEYERPEHNPWQVATLSLYFEGDVDLDGAITSLRDIPLDRRNWLIDNSHRRDAKDWPADRSGSPQFDRPFPYDEINCLKWNCDPYNVADGFMGYDVLAPTPYLIAYWTARYSGLIE